MVRVLHTADWQLGMSRRFLGNDARPRFQQARIDAVRTLGRIAAERACDLMVVAGDVFESNQVDRGTVLRALDAMGAAPCPVFLLPANHDPLDGGTIYRNDWFRARPPNVVVIENAEPIEVRPGLEVVGMPWSSKRPLDDLVEAGLARLPKARGIRIALAHGAIDRFAPDRADPARISTEAALRALADGRIHYLALGDRHSTTEVEPRIWYSGSPEATDYDEVESGQALIVELEGAECRVERVRTGRWRFHRIDAEILGAGEIAALARRLEAVEDKECAVVKLSLKGALALRDRARLDAVLEEARLKFAAVEVWARHTDLTLLPDDGDFGGLGLAGFAREALEDLVARARGAGEEAATARDALALLWRLAGGGR